MKSQVHDKPQLPSRLVKNTGMPRHAAVQKAPDEELRPVISAGARFNHSFSQVAAAVSRAQVDGQPTSMAFCPLFPQRCPFGGACHACPPRVQAKLKIGKPEDEYEQEANKIASIVESSPPPEGYFNMKGSVQQVSNDGSGRTGFDQGIVANKSVGRPLTSATRHFMEPRFGVDFRRICLHTDKYANHAASQIMSRAFTLGSHIWLGKSEKEQDKQLMAHELAHSVQQSRNQLLSNRVNIQQFTSDPMIQRTTVEVRAGCRGTQQEIEAAIADARIGIGRIANAEAKECLLDELNDANVVCDRDDGCGEASYAGSTIYVYNWGNGCPSLPALLVHETSHKCKFWWTEKFAEACENEAYGGRGATPPEPGEEGGVCEL